MELELIKRLVPICESGNFQLLVVRESNEAVVVDVVLLEVDVELLFGTMNIPVPGSRRIVGLLEVFHAVISRKAILVRLFAVLWVWSNGSPCLHIRTAALVGRRFTQA